MNGIDDLIDSPVEGIHSSPILLSNSTEAFDKTKLVPNQMPSVTMPYKIAIIGEAPGKDEYLLGRPFVGMSGKMLTQMLSKAGIVREACFIGNICQYRPPNNDIKHFSFDGDEIQHGLCRLQEDLDKFQPNICLLLGKTALRAAKGYDCSIDSWRGSLFLGEVAPFLNRKCIASFHPAACLRQYDWTPLLMFDIKKCRAEAESPTLNLPIRDIQTKLTKDEIISRLNDIQLNHTKIALDIEGGINSWSCISIAVSPTSVFIIPFAKGDGTAEWCVEDECDILRTLSNVLADETVPKILQNSLYDRFVLQYSYNILIAGTVDDTMLKSWELYCELEKGLGFLCSLYTNEPYYKSDRKSDDRDTFYRYCCKDSALTYEISNKLDKLLSAEQKKHYQFNIELLNVLLYMELRGIKYDSKLAKQRLREVNNHIFNLQYKLDTISGFGFKSTDDRNTILKTIRETLCYKKDPTKAKKGNEEDLSKATLLLQGQEVLEASTIGELNIIAGRSMNIKSKVFKDFLYEKLKLPKQIKKDPVTKKESLTTDYEALLKIQKKQPHEAVDVAIQLGELRTRSQMLEIKSDSDGRIRAGYNIVGTETGRLTCYTSPTGSGYNLQTIPSDSALHTEGHPLKRGMRDIFIADSEHYIFQCDLSGADGWTVAAHLASLGDPTMLEDYRFGIKPAKVLCWLFRHGASSLAGKSRAEIKEITSPISSKDWDYFLCKIGQHGTCYLMGATKLANQAFIQSEGKVTVSTKDTEDLQKLFFIRYNVRLWHRYVERQIAKSGTPTLTSASGHIRRFFGRKTELLGEMLAHEPQANTTYATNLAAWRLWTDRNNRLSLLSTSNKGASISTSSNRDTVSLLRQMDRNTLRIEPLHQVHDALIGQFKITDTTWAIDKLKSYFANEIIIAGQKIIIPFEGNYGDSWGNLKHSI